MGDHRISIVAHSFYEVEYRPDTDSFVICHRLWLDADQARRVAQSLSEALAFRDLPESRRYVVTKMVKPSAEVVEP